MTHEKARLRQAKPHSHKVWGQDAPASGHPSEWPSSRQTALACTQSARGPDWSVDSAVSAPDGKSFRDDLVTNNGLCVTESVNVIH